MDRQTKIVQELLNENKLALYPALVEALSEANSLIKSMLPKYITPENNTHMALYTAFHNNEALLNKAKEINQT